MTRSIPDRFSAVLMLGIALHLATLLPSLGQALAARFLRLPFSNIRIGFGPQLLAWLERAGTTWQVNALQVNALPFWVYLGAETEQQHVHSSLKRALLAASSPITRLLLALGVLAALAVAVSVPAGSARIHDVERDSTRIMRPVLPSYHEEIGAFSGIFIHGDSGLKAPPVCPAHSGTVKMPILAPELTARVLFGSVPDVECVFVGNDGIWPRPLQARGLLVLMSAAAGLLYLLSLPG